MPSTDSFSEDEYPSRDVAYKKLDGMVDRQLRQIDAIDSKIGSTLGFTGVVLSILLSNKIGSFVTIFTDPKWLDFIYLGAVALVFASLIFNIFAHKSRDYKGGPTTDNIIDVYIKADPKWTKIRMAKELSVSYRENKDIIEKKLDKFNLSLWLLFGGLGLMAVHWAYTIFNRWF